MSNPYLWSEHIDHDAFGELDLSNSGGNSGAIGCMVRRIADLTTRERHLLSELDSIRESRTIAFAALDRFITP